MIKAEICDLNIVEFCYVNSLAQHFFEMSFAESVVVFVLDQEEKLKGVISQKDFLKRKQECKIEECINYNPVTLIETAQTEEIVQHMFWTDHYEFIPIVDEDNKLKCCYFKDKIARLKPYDSYNAEAILISQINKLKKQYDEKLYLITDIEIHDVMLKTYVIKKNGLKKIDSNKSVVVLAFYETSSYIEAMTWVKKYNLCYIGCGCGCFRGRKNAMEDSRGVTDYMSIDSTARSVLMKEYVRGGYYFCLPDMENLCQIINTTKDIDGDYLEIGVFRGDTARLALHYMKEKHIYRKSYFLDTYEGFTYEAAEVSKDVMWVGSHQSTSFELVKKRLAGYENANCRKCNIITDDLPSEIEKIAVCNIDVDMEEAVYAALVKVRDKISKGGIIIAEDYGHMPELVGACYSINMFIEENKDLFTWLYFPSGQMVLIKK